MTALTPEVALSVLIDLLGDVARRHDVAITLTVTPFAAPDDESSSDSDDQRPHATEDDGYEEA